MRSKLPKFYAPDFLTCGRKGRRIRRKEVIIRDVIESTLEKRIFQSSPITIQYTEKGSEKGE